MKEPLGEVVTVAVRYQESKVICEVEGRYRDDLVEFRGDLIELVPPRLAVGAFLAHTSKQNQSVARTFTCSVPRHATP